MESGNRGDPRSEGFDVVVVGAGFAGLYALYRLRDLGFHAIGIEAGSDVGGTWYWNRYPGARCDVESLQYSFSFSDALQREWDWRERYASQPEILAYLNHVADRFDLRRDIRFDTRVTSLTFDDAQSRWQVRTDRGEAIDAAYCIMATGNLSTPRTPPIEGLEDFAGEVLRTSGWPDTPVDFTGKRVGIIGTGSSGVQAIPPIAQAAAHLTVFQRTPNFSVPARNKPLSDADRAAWKADHAGRRTQMRATRSGVLYEYGTEATMTVSSEARRAELERRWAGGGTNFLYAYSDTLRSDAANAVFADFARDKIAETVEDPETAAKLMPTDYPIGAKRICVDTDYFQTFNRDNVTLIDLRREPIDRIEPHAIRTDAAAYEIDMLIFATGFDAMTGALLAIDVRGAQGAALRGKWASGPHNYLGLMIAGFPNLFMVTGPGSPSVLSNMVQSIEQHIEWIGDCLAWLRAGGATRIEASVEAEAEWVAHVNEVARGTLYDKANSWFLGANVPGKPRVFMPYVGGFASYAQRCEDVAANGYAGFVIDRASASAP